MLSDVCEDEVHLSEKVKCYPTFASMGIRTELLKGIYKLGFERPSMIQQKSIRQIIEGRDVIAQAQSGTGKTAMFSIGTLQNVQCDLRKVQILVVAPTRELANQIHQVMSALSDYLPIRCVACCGGRSNVTQMSRELAQGAHVVVGTPGRVLDLIRHGSLRVDQLRSFVLDEADEMLNRGLRDQLEEIYRRLPLADEWSTTGGGQREGTQCVIVSATLPTEQLEMIQRFMRNPVHILVPRDQLTLDGLKQFFINVGSEEWKFEALSDLFASVCVPQTVVFVNTRRKVDWLGAQLRRDSFTVAVVHGELDQSHREAVMERFRSGESRILVSSDVWARGIDVQNVGLVVNYDVPSSPSDYLHRIGRSGRFGRRGLAVTLIAGSDDLRQLTNIARYYRIEIPPAPSSLDLMIDKPPPAPSGTVTAAHSASDPVNTTVLSLSKKKQVAVALKHVQQKNSKKNHKKRRNRRSQAVSAVTVEKKSKPSKKKRRKRVGQTVDSGVHV
ncbi:Eukaryotic initiation factor [Fasciola hepatica]|uniref:RNA helicase n=1 Tax=Fasciola hepatica TaxID=6192 RepID=A0A4E0RXU4_FASHE|nr:Eukaryotic initiation factor [Fasciola hepatica]